MSYLRRAVARYRTDGMSEVAVRALAKAARHSRAPTLERWGSRVVYSLPEDFDEFTHPPDPFAVLQVDPAEIEVCSCRAYPPYHGPDARLGVVKDGDWDRCPPDEIHPDCQPRYDLYRDGNNRFSESTYFRSLESRFIDGLAWEDTEWYQRSLEIIADGGQTSKSITSEQGLRERCTEIDMFYQTLKSEGYCSQRELSNFPVADNEVNVDIGRDGKLLFVNGRNRLAIAKLLGIEEIPVGVYVRHWEWMDYRDRIATSGTVPDHPDLWDLREKRT